jgi:hypothetical protein
MSAPILFVAGLGRCGTTMVMHMLWRGGCPVAGDPPSFETDNISPYGVNLPWLRDQAGRAVKWIDPTVARIDRKDVPAKPTIICLTRDPKEQARSQLKLIGERVNRKAVAGMARTIVSDTKLMRTRLSILGDCFTMEFEQIIRDPRAAAIVLRSLVKRTFNSELDIKAASQVVIPRWPQCAPDLSIELDLMNTYPEDAVYE